MKLKEIMVAHAFEVCESDDKVYHDEDGIKTNEKILFLLFEKAITYEGLTEDYAVMSRRVANKFKLCTDDEEKKCFLENCEFSKDDQDGHSQFAITMGINILYKFEPQQRNDKNKLKDSLLKLKKQEDDYHYDYIVIDVNKWEASGAEFKYYHSYNQYGDETDGWIVEVEDNKPKYIFNRCIIDQNIDEFVENIEILLSQRDRANAVYLKLNSYAQDIVEAYEYNNRHYAQIVWDIMRGKVQKCFYNNEYDYEERCIETQPSEGIFSMDVDEFIEEKCGCDDEGYEHLEGYFLNEKRIRQFVCDAIVSFNNLPEEFYGLFYPDEFLDY